MESLFQQAEAGLRRSLVGELKEVSVEEILIWLYERRRSAMVRIGRGLKTSSIFVEAGEITRVEHDGAIGEEALFALLALESGAFQLLLRAPPDARPNVVEPTDALLRAWFARVEREATLAVSG